MARRQIKNQSRARGAQIGAPEAGGLRQGCNASEGDETWKRKQAHGRRGGWPTWQSESEKGDSHMCKEGPWVGVIGGANGTGLLRFEECREGFFGRGGWRTRGAGPYSSLLSAMMGNALRPALTSSAWRSAERAE